MTKFTKFLLIAIPCIIVGFLLFVKLFAMLEIDYLESRLNNPIIDSDYRGWSLLELEDGLTIQFPDAWKLEYAEDKIYVIDEHGDRIAVGAKFDEEKAVEEFPAFLESVYGEKAEETTDLWSSGSYKNSARAAVKEVTLEGGGTETCLFLYLFRLDQNYNYDFCFFTDESGTLYREEVEAIAYSMWYK